MTMRSRLAFAKDRRFPFNVLRIVVIVLLLACVNHVVQQQQPLQGPPPQQKQEPCNPNIIYRRPGLPALRNRSLLGELMESRGFTDGAEVGVQKGDNAHAILTAWKSAQSFRLIDPWSHQPNYRDEANVPDEEQEKIFQQAKQTLSAWSPKTVFMRMLSTEAAKKIPDQSLDFVYIDARHDYCGVKEDIEAFYPKLRPGGILAGHDFLDAKEVKKLTPHQDWSLCMNGTVNQGAVKGAVEDFAYQNGLVTSVMYADDKWQSWMFQKPTRPECVSYS